MDWFQFTQPTTILTPVAGKTYYIDNPYWDLRLGANGSQDAFTTSTSTTGSTVEWTITASPTANFFYIDCNGGGSVPRIRTDRSENADMQATFSIGTWTRWEFTDVGNGNFLLTTLDQTLPRLQMNNAGQMKMVTTASTGTWEQFTFTEVTSSNSKSAEDNVKIEEAEIQIEASPNPVSDILKVKINADSYYQFSIYNIEGQKVLSNNISSNTNELSINFQDFNSGLYILKLIGNKSSKNLKIFKK